MISGTFLTTGNVSSFSSDFSLVCICEDFDFAGGSPYCGNCLQFSWLTFKKVPKWKLTFTNLNTFLHLFGILLLFHFQTWHRAALHTTSILVMTSSHSNYSHHSEDYICEDSSVRYRLHCQQTLLTPSPFHLHPLPGLPTMATTSLLPSSKPQWHLRIPPGCHGAYLDFGDSFRLLWLLLNAPKYCGSGVFSFYYDFLWWEQFSYPDLCGVLLGCCSPHHIQSAKKHQRYQNQKHLHCFRLDVLLCVELFSTCPLSCSTYNPIVLHFGLVFSCHLLLLPLCSLCSLGRQQRPGTGWPLKAKGVLYYYGHIGSTVLVVSRVHYYHLSDPVNTGKH